MPAPLSICSHGQPMNERCLLCEAEARKPSPDPYMTATEVEANTKRAGLEHRIRRFEDQAVQWEATVEELADERDDLKRQIALQIMRRKESDEANAILTKGLEEWKQAAEKAMGQFRALQNMAEPAYQKLEAEFREYKLLARSDERKLEELIENLRKDRDLISNREGHTKSVLAEVRGELEDKTEAYRQTMQWLHKENPPLFQKALVELAFPKEGA